MKCCIRLNFLSQFWTEMADFEEMDTINPVFDLVVFRSIKNIGLGLKALPVIYDMGVEIHPNINDWVGLFYSGWTSVKDVLKYRWTPMLPDHLNTVRRRRRSVIFDISSFAVCTIITYNNTYHYDKYFYRNYLLMMIFNNFRNKVSH